MLNDAASPLDEVSESVSLVAVKLFLESMQAMQPDVVCDTANRARVAIVTLMARCAPLLPVDGAVGDASFPWSSPPPASVQEGVLHRGTIVYRMLQYLQAAKSIHRPPDDRNPTEGGAAGANAARRYADERALRDSENRVIHILVTFIVSSSSEVMSADVRSAFQGHLVFLIFAANAQLRRLEAEEGRRVEVVLNAPPVTSHGALEGVPALPPAMDYYWLLYYVLLLVGAEGMQETLRRLGEPLVSLSYKDSTVRQQEGCTLLEEGLQSVGGRCLHLCVSYGRILTNEVAAPESTFGAPVPPPRPTTSEASTMQRTTGITVGDVLAHARQHAQAEYHVFPPPRLAVLLGRCRPSLRPARKRLVVPTETLHVLPRLSAVVAVVVECLCDVDRAGCHASSRAILDPLLLVWTLRLTAYAVVLCLGGTASPCATGNDALNDAAQLSERRGTVLAALRCAQLLVRMHAHRRQHNHGAPHQSDVQHPWAMRHVLTLGFHVAILRCWEPSAADVLQSLIAHTVTHVGQEHAAHGADEGRRPLHCGMASASECFSSIALVAMEGVMSLVDAVDLCCAPSLGRPDQAEHTSPPLALLGERVAMSIEVLQHTVGVLVAEVREHLVDDVVLPRTQQQNAAPASPRRYVDNSAQRSFAQMGGTPARQPQIPPTDEDDTTRQYLSCTLECLGALMSLLGTWQQQYVSNSGEESLWHLALAALEISRNQQLGGSSNHAHSYIARIDPSSIDTHDGCWFDHASLRSKGDAHMADPCSANSGASAPSRVSADATTHRGCITPDVGIFGTALRLFARTLIVLTDRNDSRPAHRGDASRGETGSKDVLKVVSTLTEAFAQLLLVMPQVPRATAAELYAASMAIREKNDHQHHLSNGATTVLLAKQCALYAYRRLELL